MIIQIITVIIPKMIGESDTLTNFKKNVFISTPKAFPFNKQSNENTEAVELLTYFCASSEACTSTGHLKAKRRNNPFPKKKSTYPQAKNN
jgi:hypothetical protein